MNILDEQITIDELELVKNIMLPDQNVDEHKDINKINNNINNNMLFMFLGGLPMDDKHYQEFFKTTDKTFYIVAHPQTLENYKENITKNEFYKKLYEEGRLLIVDNEHHVRTKWATFSLVSATLLMMQYALVQKGDIFKKFVLLSQNDKPLYNYKVIYEELNVDNKSWIYYSDDNAGYARYFLKASYENQGGFFSTQDIVYVSQWMAIDRKHIPFFIDINGNNFKTYKKFGTFNCSNTELDNIITYTIDSDFHKQLKSFIGSYQEEFTYDDLIKILDNGYCIGTDEYFFGNVIKKHLKNEDELKTNIRYETISNLNIKNKYEYVKSVGNENFYLKDSKTIYNTTLSDIKYTDEYRTWYGSSPKFGDAEIRIQIIKNKNSSSENDKYFIIKDKKIITIGEKDLIKLKDENKNDAINFYNSLKGGTYRDNSMESNINLGKINELNFNDIYTLSTTYTDWSSVNANPSNMFRNFQSTYFTENGENLFPDTDNVIKLIESKEPAELFNTYFKNKKRKEQFVNDQYIIGPSYHPMEYLLFTLKSIVNAYNFIVFFELDDKSKTGYFNVDLKIAKSIYLEIIKQNTGNIVEIADNTNYYCFAEGVSDEIKNKNYGHPITSFSLNNALAYGALFIRKVLNNSLMENYTEQLLNLTKYVIKDTKTWNSRPDNFKNNDSVIFTNILSGGNNDTYYQKYLKYKNKYLSLKNN